MEKNYELLDCSNGLKIKAYGKNLAEVFVNMALGLVDQQFKQKEDKIIPGQWEEIEISAPELESLMVDWLNELIYRGNASQMGYLGFDILQIFESKLHAKIKGIHAPEKFMDVKAAVRREVEVKKERDHWEAKVVFEV